MCTTALPPPQNVTVGLEMLDITRDKPVKVAVRVAVPVQDHPKFNFVGKLLGPKGNSMKRLQEDTLCKMAVLGRGSMRDRKKEEELRASGDSRYAHLSEDLHVEISTFAAPAEAHARIAYALAEVRRFLVPDYHDDIRREQMWEMQALTATPPSGMLQQQLGGDSGVMTTASAIGENVGDFKSELSNVADGWSLAAAAAAAGKEAAALAGNTSSTNTNPAAAANSNDLHKYSSMSGFLPPERECEPTTTTSIGDIAAAAAAAAELDPTGSTSGTSAAAMQHHSAIPMAVASQTNAKLFITNENELVAPAMNFLDFPRGLIQPATAAALRGVKTINIATAGIGRKRSLLGVPRFSMNPTKRSVMTLLARAKNSQSLHIRNPTIAAKTPARFNERPLMLATAPPFILHSHMPMDQTMITTLPKENLAQGV